jgi:hypothetical protein
MPTNYLFHDAPVLLYDEPFLKNDKAITTVTFSASTSNEAGMQM